MLLDDTASPHPGHSSDQLPGVKKNISWHPSDILAYSVWPSDHVRLYYCNPR